MLSIATIVTLLSVSNSRDHRTAEFQRIKDYEIISFDLDELDTDNRLKLKAFGETYKVILEPQHHHILSKVSHNADPSSLDAQILSSFTNSCHYFGTTYSQSDELLDTHSPLSLCSTQGIRGKINIPNDVLVVYPAAYFLDREVDSLALHNVTDPHLVYKMSDFDTSDIGQAGIVHSQHDSISREFQKSVQQSLKEGGTASSNGRRKLLALPNNGQSKLEMMIMTEPIRLGEYQRDYPSTWLSQMVIDFTNMVNSVSAEYAKGSWTQIGTISIHFRYLEIIERFTGRYASMHPNFLDSTCTTLGSCQIDGRDWLSKLKSWLSAYKDLTEFDNVQLISSMEFRSNYAGWGNMGTVCRGASSCSDMYDGWGLTFLAHTVAHELGHNFGAYHDAMGNNDCGSHDGVMGYGMQKGWSTCSVGYFEAYFANNNGLTCLGNTPRSMEVIHVNPDSVTSQPTPKPTNRPTSKPTAKPTGKPTAKPIPPTNRPTNKPTVKPTGKPTGITIYVPPSTNVNLCDSFDAIQVTGMKTDYWNHPINGATWRPSGCHNGQAIYKSDSDPALSALSLCYDNTYKRWTFTESLCESEDLLYARSYCNVATATTNIMLCTVWEIQRSHGWASDVAVQVYDAGGNFNDNTDNLQCLENPEYGETLCITSSNNNTLWFGDKTFELVTYQCQNDRPIYQHISLLAANIEQSPYTGSAVDTVDAIYFLHFHEQLKFTDSNETIPQWIISKDEVSINYVAYCEQDDLLDCTTNQWIVQNTEFGEVFGDGFLEDVEDQIMTINIESCPEDMEQITLFVKEAEDATLRMLRVNMSWFIAAAVTLCIICIVIICVLRQRMCVIHKNMTKLSDGDIMIDERAASPQHIKGQSMVLNTLNSPIDTPLTPGSPSCVDDAFDLNQPGLSNFNDDAIECQAIQLDVSLEKSPEETQEIVVYYS